MAELQFIHENGQQVIAEMKAELETILNRQIADADIEMLLINAFAYRETLLRTQVNQVGRQSYVEFSEGSALEYLAQMVGVYRLPAAGASCTIQFNLVAGHNGVVIPAGLRVQSLDGKVIFKTIAERVVPVGTNTVSVEAVCSTEGKVGNNYAPGTISVIVDPKAFISTAQNTANTSGGTDKETDKELRERIKLAPASFSVAGPAAAYRFFAKSAHPSIVDVAVTSPVPGQVNIYPLLEDGVLPSAEILDAVQAICNGEKVRPLTDTVVTASPTVIEYSISIDVWLLNTAISSQTINDITTTLNDYVSSRKERLGLDVVRHKLASLCMNAGKVYNVDVLLPAADIVAGANEYTKCTGITINLRGTNEE